MQYQRERFDMLLKAGLRKLFEEREAVLERVGWEVEGEPEGVYDF